MTNDYWQMIEESDALKQQRHGHGSTRTICLSDEQADEITKVIIPRAVRWIDKQMYKGHHLDIEFLNGVYRTILYDKHLSQKQIDLFFHIVDQVPKNIESGLI